MNAKWARLIGNLKTVSEALEPLVVIVSAITAVVTFSVSELYKAEDRDQEILDRAEARSLPFYEKQLDIYAEAARITARLATTPESDPSRPALVERFWELYWGDLNLVESSDIAAKMDNICRAYVSAKNPERCTMTDKPGEGLALDLANQAAREIKARWIVSK
jgi:hypothetical protein